MTREREGTKGRRNEKRDEPRGTRSKVGRWDGSQTQAGDEKWLTHFVVAIDSGGDGGGESVVDGLVRLHAIDELLLVLGEVWRLVIRIVTN